MDDHEDEVCLVCFDGDSIEKNVIVFCSGCDIAVHQLCYGIKEIPKDDWLCKTCVYYKKFPKANKLQCILCTTEGGALKPTDKINQWAHITCAQWIPETFINGYEDMEPISGIDRIIPDRKTLKCKICKKNEGYCIQCSNKRCCFAYHPLCGYKHNRAGMKRTELVDGGSALYSYCSKHLSSAEENVAPSYSKFIDVKSNLYNCVPAPPDKSTGRNSSNVHFESSQPANKENGKSKSEFSDMIQIDHQSKLCDVCNEDLPDLKLLKCITCQVRVHTQCYGVIEDSIAESWCCDRCESNNRILRTTKCSVCPDLEGAFKATLARPGVPKFATSTSSFFDSGWVHVVCALAIPEMSVVDPVTINPIDGLHRINMDRFNVECTLCYRHSGACIQCNAKRCNAPFHPRCALRAGLRQETIEIDGVWKFFAFCSSHRNYEIENNNSDNLFKKSEIHLTFKDNGTLILDKTINVGDNQIAIASLDIDGDDEDDFSVPALETLSLNKPRSGRLQRLSTLASSPSPANITDSATPSDPAPSTIVKVGRGNGRKKQNSVAKTKVVEDENYEYPSIDYSVEREAYWSMIDTFFPSLNNSASVFLKSHDNLNLLNDPSFFVPPLPFVDIDNNNDENNISSFHKSYTDSANIMSSCGSVSYGFAERKCRGRASNANTSKATPKLKSNFSSLINVDDVAMFTGFDSLIDEKSNAVSINLHSLQRVDKCSSKLTNFKSYPLHKPENSFLGIDSYENCDPEDEILLELLSQQNKLVSLINNSNINKTSFRNLVKCDNFQSTNEEISHAESKLINSYKFHSHMQVIRHCLIRGVRDVEIKQKPIVVQSILISEEKEKEPEDEYTVCCVCFDGEANELNPIVYCERCNISVHKTCYGISSIPDDDWNCDLCVNIKQQKLGKKYEERCILCPVEGGALKITEDGRWGHIACTLWNPDVRMRRIEKMEPIEHLAPAFENQAKLGAAGVCSVCKQNFGLTLACKETGCQFRAHPLCSWYNGNFMSVDCHGDNLSFNLYCEIHSKGELHGLPLRSMELQKNLRNKGRQDQLAIRTSAGLDKKDMRKGEDKYEIGRCAVCFQDEVAPAVDVEEKAIVNENPLVRCCRCNIEVHKVCYGINLPAKQLLNWYCRRCERRGQKKVECCLCPRKGGAFKPTVDGRWCHVSCAAWIPEVNFVDDFLMEPVAGITKIPKERFNLKCYLCKKDEGACITCTTETSVCYLAFHPLCGLMSGACMRVYNGSFISLCKGHTPIYKIRNVPGVSIPEQYSLLLRLRRDLDKARTLIDLCKRRERLKKNQITNDNLLFDERSRSEIFKFQSKCFEALTFAKKLSKHQKSVWGDGSTENKDLLIKDTLHKRKNNELSSLMDSSIDIDAPRGSRNSTVAARSDTPSIPERRKRSDSTATIEIMQVDYPETLAPRNSTTTPITPDLMKKMRMESFEKANVSLNNVIASDSRSSRSRVPSVLSLEIAASAPIPKSVTKSTPRPSILPALTPAPESKSKKIFISPIPPTPVSESKGKKLSTSSIKKGKSDSTSNMLVDVQSWRLGISSKPLASSAVIYLKKQKRNEAAVIEEVTPVEEKKRSKSNNKVNNELSKINSESTAPLNIKDEVIVDDGFDEVYVARVLDYNADDNEYFLHYLGWNSKSDKWVPRDRLLKRTLYDLDNEI